MHLIKDANQSDTHNVIKSSPNKSACRGCIVMEALLIREKYILNSKAID